MDRSDVHFGRGPFGKIHVRFGKGAKTSGPRPRWVPMLDGLDLILRLVSRRRSPHGSATVRRCSATRAAAGFIGARSVTGWPISSTSNGWPAVTRRASGVERSVQPAHAAPRLRDPQL